MSRRSQPRRRSQARDQVALEAAKLLYHGACKEYIDAKREAAKSLGVKPLPSNYEVALKLLEYALSLEGESYWTRLRRLREEALKIMEAIKDLNPRLVGSVWRGIVRPESDIDIEVDSEEVELVERKLREAGYEPESVEPINLPEPMRMGSLWRIRLKTSKGSSAEIILKDHLSYMNPARCDIFGDPRKGLNLMELKEILEKEPEKLFIPKRRPRNGDR